jgi:hypothetical protein
MLLLVALCGGVLSGCGHRAGRGEITGQLFEEQTTFSMYGTGKYPPAARAVVWIGRIDEGEMEDTGPGKFLDILATDSKSDPSHRWWHMRYDEYYSAKTRYKTKTDEQGRFGLRNIKPGFYRVLFSYDGRNAEISTDVGRFVKPQEIGPVGSISVTADETIELGRLALVSRYVEYARRGDGTALGKQVDLVEPIPATARP